MSRTKAVVLAAGKGTRMKSELPKVLVRAAGRPLIEYVLDALQDAGVDEAIVVVGYRADDVRATLAGRPGIAFALQSEQLGTGHAVQMAADQLRDHQGAVLVVTGDSPMTQADSLRALLDLYEREHPACVLGTLLKDEPTGLGRIVRDADGRFAGIVEDKDATPEQRAIKEVNMSTYVFDCQALLQSLGALQNNNRQAEYYLTDCPGILQQLGQDVRAWPVLQPCEALSVNTVEDLEVVAAELAKRSCLPG